MKYIYKITEFMGENKTSLVVVLAIVMALAILGIIRRIKAAIISLVVIGITAIALMSMYYLAHSSYNLSYDGEIISITSDGESYEFEIDDISSLRLNGSTSKEDYLLLEISFKDGRQTSVEFPDYLEGDYRQSYKKL